MAYTANLYFLTFRLLADGVYSKLLKLLRLIRRLLPFRRF